MRRARTTKPPKEKSVIRRLYSWIEKMRSRKVEGEPITKNFTKDVIFYEVIEPVYELIRMYPADKRVRQVIGLSKEEFIECLAHVFFPVCYQSGDPERLRKMNARLEAAFKRQYIVELDNDGCVLDADGKIVPEYTVQCGPVTYTIHGVDGLKRLVRFLECSTSELLDMFVGDDQTLL